MKKFLIIYITIWAVLILAIHQNNVNWPMSMIYANLCAVVVNLLGTITGWTPWRRR